MKKTALILFAAIIALACNQPTSAQQTSDKQISEVLAPEAFQEKINELSNEILLDIRTPDEQAEGIINGSQMLDFYDANFKAELAKLNREVPVMVYCRSGGRSGKTASMLKSMGFKEVYDLQGGIGAWQDAGMEIATPQ